METKLHVSGQIGTKLARFGLRVKEMLREGTGIASVDHWKATLCARCEEALRSNEPLGGTISQESIAQSPETCPLCAIAEFFCSLHQKNFNKVKLRFSEEPRSECQLKIVFYTDDWIGMGSVRGMKVRVSPGTSHDTNSLPTTSSSPESINLLKQQLQRCLKGHQKCRPASNIPPSRLLQVDTSVDSRLGSDSTVHLVDGSVAVDRSYATLSHCWGKAHFKQLTAATEDQLRAGISTQELPKTFQDAIYVCQQLDQQYLWIDSLCIRQDDPEDWEREAARMHAVYSNALFNIAATGAIDSSVGLFFERNPLAHQPFCIYTDTTRRNKWMCVPDWSDHTIQESPLNQRAWVSQERFLSNRIMHFTSTGVYWECFHSSTSDVLPTYRPVGGCFQYEFLGMSKAMIASRNVGLNGPIKKLRSTDTLYSFWISLVAAYNRCGLTKEEDKLIAFNGIAQRMREGVGATITCGLWKQYIVQELQWRVDNSYDRKDMPLVQKWRAPSWSWASGDYRLSTTWSIPDHRKRCKQFTEPARVLSLEADTLPTGKVLSATLNLRGESACTSVRIQEFHWKRSLPALVVCADAEYRIDSRCFVFDRLPPTPYEEQLTFIALSRCFCKADGVYLGEDNKKHKIPTEPRPWVVALMLRQLPTTPPTYNRVGILWITGDDCRMYDESKSTQEEEFVLV